MRQPFIKINNYKKQYNTHTVSLKDLEFSKRITVIKGENGSGKSTLLKSLCNYLEYDGEITVNTSLAYMSDLFYFPIDCKVLDFINCHQAYYHYSQEKISNLILLFELEEKMDEYIYTLSKGMKMKLNLIVTLARKENCYLLDEPLSGLDKESQKKLIDYINHDEKFYIITSHIDHHIDLLNGEVIVLKH